MLLSNFSNTSFRHSLGIQSNMPSPVRAFQRLKLKIVSSVARFLKAPPVGTWPATRLFGPVTNDSKQEDEEEHTVTTSVFNNLCYCPGCPVTTSGITVNRFCSSGLNAIAMASHSVLAEGVSVAVGGGVDSLSLCLEVRKFIGGFVVGVARALKFVASSVALWSV